MAEAEAAAAIVRFVEEEGIQESQCCGASCK